MPENLDNIFPYVVLAYGAIMTAVLNSPLVEHGAERLPPKMMQQLVAHRGLGLLCLGTGFVWSMQTLWLGA